MKGTNATSILITSRDVAELLGCAPKTVERLARHGDFPPGLKVGRMRRWSRAHVLDWIEKKALTASQAT